jgi:hypothetical protein
MASRFITQAAEKRTKQSRWYQKMAKPMMLSTIAQDAQKVQTVSKPGYNIISMSFRCKEQRGAGN